MQALSSFSSTLEKLQSLKVDAKSFLLIFVLYVNIGMIEIYPFSIIKINSDPLERIIRKLGLTKLNLSIKLNIISFSFSFFDFSSH